MDLRALRDIGMNEAEISVYATLIAHRPLSAREIAEISGLYRPYVYDTLTKLLEKGLVTRVRGPKAHLYRAVHPGRIAAIIDERRARVLEAVDRLRDAYRETDADESVRIFEGSEALKAFYEEVYAAIREDRTRRLYVIGGTGEATRHIEYFFPKLLQRGRDERLHHRVDIRMIYNASAGASEIARSYSDAVTLRFTPPDRDAAATTIITDTMLAIMVLKERPFVVAVSNRQIVETYMLLFDRLWEGTSPKPE
ncbi:MarR family transcriptional regulator [Methanoculleus sp. FWC-SCC1]|uniref:MarR family transcriptional regulator n=1 Tax=Methanoculleus frigidifontis TaxID=2584085 RepID=A0ABT8M9H7_9EURY|nr:TrmB family transcriptional regulator [Methanoculleus sp. FWC-SCC1]MDN7024583.1 MarR family transcriptional regulator [Methanoculleus sp. FWC-SCC1]